MAEEWLRVEVVDRRVEAEGIVGFDLRAVDGGGLPAFEAGAHVEVELPNGAVRSYSLCNSPAETDRYQIAVLREPNGRGGSTSAHVEVEPGRRLRIRPPRNLFALAREPHVLLIGGGIGITPMLAMAERLTLDGRRFDLHYCVRSRARAAFLDRLRRAPYAARVHLHLDDGEAAQRFDAASALGAAPAGSGLYVCGPRGFMDHVLAAARGLGWPETRVHTEYFAAAPMAVDGADRPFELVLARSGRRILVPVGTSAATALFEAGVEIALSCEQGICGTCALPVLSGVPDHRDSYQTRQERETNARFMPCCSRSSTAELVVDL